MQSKRMSLIESVASTAVGFVVAMLTQAVVFPLFGIHVDMETNAELVLVFTVLSVARSYVMRRLFNRLHAVPLRQALEDEHDPY